MDFTFRYVVGPAVAVTSVITTAVVVGGGYLYAGLQVAPDMDVANKIKNFLFDRVPDSTEEGAKVFVQKVGAGTINAVGEGLNSPHFKEALTKLINSLGTVFTSGLGDLNRVIGDMSKHFGNIGTSLAKNLKEISAPSLHEVAGIFRDFMKNISFTMITTWVPTMVAWGALSVGTPLLLRYIYYRAKHMIGRPSLMIEYKTITIFTPVKELCSKITQLFRNASEQIKTPFFNAEVTRRTNEIIKATYNIKKHGGNFQNLILHGPGGTGKTMIASKIAREAGMNYIMMSGGDLAQYIKRGEHVTELNKMLKFANNGSQPTILFIDEAEAMCKNRDVLDQEHTELLDGFLKQTGEANKNMMIIMATNRLHDIDPAVLSRMDHKVHVGAPDYTQRMNILRQYVQRQFSKTDINNFFTDRQIGSIASRTTGLTGRALEKLVNAIYCKKATTDDNKLTQRLINESIYDFVTQERDLPGAERSWLFVERISDFWYFTIPAISNYCMEIISAIGAVLSGTTDFGLSEAVTEKIRDMGYADWFGILPKAEPRRWSFWPSALERYV